MTATKRQVLPIAVLSVALLVIAPLAGCGDSRTPAEVVADAFADSLSAVFDQGVEFEADGLVEVAEYMYGTAAAGTSAMRYAVDNLIAQRDGTALEAVVGDRLGDWDQIAALGYASAYPYLFQGFVADAQGHADEAAALYAKALLNPRLLEHSEYLKSVTQLDSAALGRVKAKLTALEDKIFAVYAPPGLGIPRDERNFNDAWLRLQAQDKLKQTADDYDGALAFYRAAVAVNPYNGDNYAGCATMYLFKGDAGAALHYINDGLIVDSSNAPLVTMLDSVKKVLS